MGKCSLLNVDKNEIVGTCDDKCKFIATYEPSPLRMKVDNQQNIKVVARQRGPSVIFNGIEYTTASTVSIRKNLMHNYNNVNVVCELSIAHTSDNGEFLLVIIPILKSNRATKTSGIFKTIVNLALTMEPNKNQNFKDNYFNFQDFIPTSNLLYYNATLKKMNNRKVHLVTFEPNTNITMDSETVNKLNKILTKEENYCFNKQMDVTSGLYSNNTYNKNSIINSNVVVSVEPIDKGKEEERKIKEMIKDELRDLEYGANLKTSMEDGTMENADAISDNMTNNMAKSVVHLLKNNEPPTNNESSNMEVEGFTVEGMFCDSPNDEQLMKIAKYAMGVSLIGSILYVGSKVFSNKR